MNGTAQLLSYLFVFGAGAGIGLNLIEATNPFILVGVFLLWGGFVFNLADALWSPFSARGREWNDRIGILVRAVGFAVCIASTLLSTKEPFIVLATGIIGLLTILFGRALWELMTYKQESEPVE